MAAKDSAVNNAELMAPSLNGFLIFDLRKVEFMEFSAFI